jgi:hypothetical protein
MLKHRNREPAQNMLKHPQVIINMFETQNGASMIR